MSKKILGVILSAGTSSRFSDLKNDDISLPENLKQYKKLNDKYIIQYSLDNFLELKEMGMIDKILVVIRREDQDFFLKEILEKFDESQRKEINFCFGGQTRSESVLNSTKYANEKMSQENFQHALIHDAARPFASLNLFVTLINHIKNNNDIDCVFPALKFNDAVRIIKGSIFSTVDRANLHAVQTPQIFHFQKLKLAFEFEEKEHINEYPFKPNFYDEVTMFEKYGGKIDFIKGEKENIKITFKDDLDQK
jgi:2-C-methyl-D-erythritol 4-phosphate cytidylyltransferase